MRRAAGGLIFLGLVGAAAAAIASGSIAHAAAPPSEGCTWQQHSKRVVKHLRRHGRVQRVKRVKHWWACDGQPAVSAPPTPPAPPPAPPAPPATAALPLEEPKPEGLVSHLSVKALEWSYTLSRPEVPSGVVIVELNNQGEDNHNLKLQREGSGEPPLAVPEAAAEERTTASLTLPPGTYRLYCSLFEHDEKACTRRWWSGRANRGSRPR